MRVGSRFSSRLSLCSLLSLAGCSELVVLGTECPSKSALGRASEGSSDVCPVAEDAGAPRDAQIRDSASGPRVDSAAAPATDAAPATSSVVLPVLGNAGFELKRGDPGNVTTLSSTVIDPWYTCQPIGGPDSTTAVRAERSVTLTDNETPAGQVVTSPDGSDTFIEIQLLIGLVPFSLLQKLEQPLHIGEHYGFAIDVQSPNPSAGLSLQVRGTNADDACLNIGSEPVVLVESDTISTPGWQTLCLPFTSTAEYSTLMLSLKSAAPITGALTGLNARLLFDNIRAATPALCPGL